jgi:recombinational DNA repair protein (RecF pathway)
MNERERAEFHPDFERALKLRFCSRFLGSAGVGPGCDRDAERGRTQAIAPFSTARGGADLGKVLQGFHLDWAAAGSGAKVIP